MYQRHIDSIFRIYALTLTLWYIVVHPQYSAQLYVSVVYGGFTTLTPPSPLCLHHVKLHAAGHV